MTNVTPDSSFNTAISFVTNTNWQGYSGESTMSYLTQMLGLAVHNFVSAATGIAVAVALLRGFARHSAATIGNFWVHLTRAALYLSLPIAKVSSKPWAARSARRRGRNNRARRSRSSCRRTQHERKAENPHRR